MPATEVDYELDDQTDQDILSNAEVEEAADSIGEQFYAVDYSISSYGADYPVDGLVKRIEAGSIYIPTFQRKYVWNIYRASRFIESLLLGLPVPAIFLSKELDSNRLLVIDGQQRLRTLQYFYAGVFEPDQQAFKLKGVHQRFDGKTYKTLSQDERIKLDDSLIHAIIVKQEEPDEGNTGTQNPSSVYHIFERLNTGGMLLQPQEIRTCIFHGPFIELLETLNGDIHWRRLFGKISSRMRDRELILRFFALYDKSGSYAKPMKEFLTNYLAGNKNITGADAERLSSLFRTTAQLIDEAIGEKAFKPKRAVNAALCDSLMVGIASRAFRNPVTDLVALKAQYDALMLNNSFQTAINSGTTDESNVKDRLRLSIDAFSAVP